MDWLTKDYIQAEAKKGRKQAIECTRLHWQQLVKAGPKELARAYDERKVTIKISHCALCQKYYNPQLGMKCPKCLLKCKDVWRIGETAFCDWLNNPTRANWRKWKQASKAMLDKIDRLHERLYGSKK